MAGDDITIEILKGIREDMRERFGAMDQRFDAMDRRFDAMDQRLDTMEERTELITQRLDITNERLGVVESTLLTLARRQRLTLRYAKSTAVRLDGRVTDLEARVGRLESR
jgi:hypothetical protein